MTIYDGCGFNTIHRYRTAYAYLFPYNIEVALAFRNYDSVGSNSRDFVMRMPIEAAHLCRGCELTGYFFNYFVPSYFVISTTRIAIHLSFSTREPMNSKTVSLSVKCLVNTHDDLIIRPIYSILLNNIYKFGDLNNFSAVHYIHIHHSWFIEPDAVFCRNLQQPWSVILPLHSKA